jgi:cytochrome P450
MKEKMNRYLTVMGKVRNYSSDLVAKVIQDTNPDEKPLTVAHAISKAVREMDEDEKKVLRIDDEYIKGLVGSLFGAGFGTIAITIRWALLLMAKHPRIQERVFDELDTIVGGRDSQPKFSDSSKLPYFNAFINELYRYSSIASVAVTHRCTQDTTFHGYFIAEDTPVIVNLYSAHYDTRVFPDPFKFDPERFLNSSGEFDSKAAENVIPYGQGHRRCGGEALGRLELFMFLATIFQRCKVEEAPGEVLDPNDYAFTWALDPKPFKVVLKSRYGEW